MSSAVAQPCFCGEAICKGYIGGSLKSDSKLPAPNSSQDPLDVINNTLENDDDEDDEDDDDDDDDEDDEDDDGRIEQKDDSDTVEAVTLTQKKMLRKMHRRRASEPLQDPREVQSFVKRMLDSVGKSHLVLKLLLRLQLTDAETPQGKDILKKFVRLHGLKMLKFWLGEWKNDTDILIKVLQVLSQLPLANKNGLEDCKMFEVVGKLTTHEQQDIRELAEKLLHNWNQLKSVYRIPKRISTEKPNHKREREEDDDMQSQVSSLDRVPPSHYHSSREFFDPDEDYFEYFSMDVDAAEIQWKLDYPPRSMIPTAPRAMIDACIKNGFYGYGRPTRQQSTYPSYPPSIEHQHHHYTEQDVSPYKNSSKYTNDTSPDNASPAGSIASIALTRPAAASTPPPKLPNNWRTAYAEDGTIYYYHRITGKTQWQFPEERVSSIEGVNQSDLEDLVEKTIQESENKKRAEKARSESPAISIASRGQLKNSPRVTTPSVSRRGSSEAAASLDENELKKEVGKIVTKYLSSKQKTLWKGDKYLFKELARKVGRIQMYAKDQCFNSFGVDYTSYCRSRNPIVTKNIRHEQ